MKVACGKDHYDLVIGADGVNSSVRAAISSKTYNKPKYNNLKVFYSLRQLSASEKQTNTQHEMHQYLCERSVVVNYPVSSDIEMTAFLVRDYECSLENQEYRNAEGIRDRDGATDAKGEGPT